MINPFFINKGPFEIKQLLELSNISNTKNYSDNIIVDVKDLVTSTKDHITFFHSKKYENLALKTKAVFCITTKNLVHLLPKSCNSIIVENVLIAIAKITSEFYPNAITDNFDNTVIDINETSLKVKVKFGKNVLVGKNVTIGKNCLVGHNTIIESNVIIGDDCSIGSNVIIRNTILKNNINILDGCVIGKKGFGFFPNKDKNFRYPHIGLVMINDNC